MGFMEYLLGALLLAISIALVVVVLFQKDRASSSKNAFEANSDTYYGKNKGRSKDAMMSKFTTILAISVFVIAIALNLFVLAPKYADNSSSLPSSSETSSSTVGDTDEDTVGDSDEDTVGDTESAPETSEDNTVGDSDAE